MGKRELIKAPFVRQYFKNMHILVDRKSNVDSHKAFKKAAEELRKGNSVVIFPEGTISKNAPALSPFKNGAFKLAAEEKIPIVPITFLTNFKLLQDGPLLKAPCRPGIAKSVIHKPIFPNDDSFQLNPESLKAETKNIIYNELKKHYKL